MCKILYKLDLLASISKIQPVDKLFYSVWISLLINFVWISFLRGIFICDDFAIKMKKNLIKTVSSNSVF